MSSVQFLDMSGKKIMKPVLIQDFVRAPIKDDIVILDVGLGQHKRMIIIAAEHTTSGSGSNASPLLNVYVIPYVKKAKESDGQELPQPEGEHVPIPFLTDEN